MSAGRPSPAVWPDGPSSAWAGRSASASARSAQVVVCRARLELLGVEHPAVRGDRGGHALDRVLAERAEHAPARLLAVGARDDQLREHGVVVAGDLAALPEPGVDAHEWAGGLDVAGDAPGPRHEVAAGVLGVDAAFDRGAARLDREAGDRATHRDLELQGDEVEPRDHLGDGVLDLQPRVHLQEVEVAVLVDDALDRAGVHVAGLARERDRRVGEPLAHRVVDRGRGRLLDQLLVAPLHRAVALPEEHHVAVGVGEDLRLDVVGAVDVSLEEDLGPAEVRLRLARPALQRLLEVAGVADDVHALAAAAEGGLHEQREADALGLLPRLLRVDGLGRAGHDRHAARVGGAAGGRLVAHHLDRLRRRADEREPRVGRRPRRSGRAPTGSRTRGGSGSPWRGGPRRGSPRSTGTRTMPGRARCGRPDRPSPRAGRRGRRRSRRRRS